MRRRWLSLVVFSAIVSGCARVSVEDVGIRAHWMEANETAPFRGLLMDDRTYYRLRMEILKCRHGE